MKKVLFILVISLFLAACGKSEASNEPENKEKNEEDMSQSEWIENQEKDNDKELTEEEQEAHFEETGEIIDPEFGIMKTVGVGFSDEVGIDGTDAPIKPIEMGPMKLFIESVAILDVEPNEDMKFMFDDKDKARAVIVDMKVENTSDDDITFDPNSAIIVTDTGEQVESDLMLMGDAGGDFLGKVTKEGQTWWLLKDLEKDVKELTMIISPPYKTENWEDEGEEKRIKFEVLNWEDAKKKDGKE
ncbi:DUF4352 domain-containing protein [Cytobacillus kochii]|uniref:DUF4352 domain-containing protein n=1 Tax=Cytobacillus kochii TaxID=859143 RepID=UPI001CD438F7|nr:DUF4352 domain-containing protein [Cytobacillus kochii]MCA1028348.1 DUF4352 domain-containing protein [Cytobacillus kochii]